MFRSLRPAAMLFAFTFAACGGSSTPGDASTTDASGTDASGNDAGALTPVSRLGEVSIESSTTLSGPGAPAKIAVGFRDFASMTNHAQCGTRTIGSCRFMFCSLDLFTHFEYVGGGAGTVTITGGTGGPWMVTPDATTGLYSQSGAADVSYAAGDAIHVDAAGGPVPGFMADLHFPRAITRTTPAPFTEFSVQRSAGFTVSWTGSTEDVFIVIAEHGASGDPMRWAERELRCVYPGAAGTATIPPEALANLVAMPDSQPSGAWSDYADVEIGTISEQEVMAGDYPVWLEARNTAVGTVVGVQ